VDDAAAAAQAVGSAAGRGRYDHAVSHSFREKAAADKDLNNGQMRIFASVKNDFVHGVHVRENVAIAAESPSLRVKDTNP
jgi:hypothetical protein